MLPGYLNCLAPTWTGQQPRLAEARRPLIPLSLVQPWERQPSLRKRRSTGGINGPTYMHTTVLNPTGPCLHHPRPLLATGVSSSLSLISRQRQCWPYSPAMDTPLLPRPKDHKALRQGCPRASRPATWLVRRC
ncbi:hypothetical protein J3E69DRAFT_166920 [Trichoderma sp. SZMC 28015]